MSGYIQRKQYHLEVKARTGSENTLLVQRFGSDSFRLCMLGNDFITQVSISSVGKTEILTVPTHHTVVMRTELGGKKKSCGALSTALLHRMTRSTGIPLTMTENTGRTINGLRVEISLGWTVRILKPQESEYSKLCASKLNITKNFWLGNALNILLQDLN